MLDEFCSGLYTIPSQKISPFIENMFWYNYEEKYNHINNIFNLLTAKINMSIDNINKLSNMSSNLCDITIITNASNSNIKIKNIAELYNYKKNLVDTLHLEYCFINLYYDSMMKLIRQKIYYGLNLRGIDREDIQPINRFSINQVVNIINDYENLLKQLINLINRFNFINKTRSEQPFLVQASEISINFYILLYRKLHEETEYYKNLQLQIRLHLQTLSL